MHRFPASPARNFLLLLLMPIIATLDSAALLGSINWLFLDRLHLRIPIVNNGPDGKQLVGRPSVRYYRRKSVSVSHGS